MLQATSFNVHMFFLFFPETLRKYPILPQLTRISRHLYAAKGDRHFYIEPDQMILIPVYGIHHDPALYPEPQRRVYCTCLPLIRLLSFICSSKLLKPRSNSISFHFTEVLFDEVISLGLFTLELQLIRSELDRDIFPVFS